MAQQQRLQLNRDYHHAYKSLAARTALCAMSVLRPVCKAKGRPPTLLQPAKGKTVNKPAGKTTSSRSQGIPARLFLNLHIAASGVAAAAGRLVSPGCSACSVAWAATPPKWLTLFTSRGLQSPTLADNGAAEAPAPDSAPGLERQSALSTHRSCASRKTVLVGRL